MIAIGSDHAGFEFKNLIIAHLQARDIVCKDFGTYSEASCDYPLIADEVCEAVLNKSCRDGILICGTGVGMSIAANKKRGIRAALCSDCFTAKATREHNDANLLVLGARVIGIEHAKMITDFFLDSKFSGEERHQKRIDMFE